MSEVSCRITAPVIRSLVTRGYDPQRLVQGLPFRLDTLENPSNRISWHDYNAVLANCADLVGGVEALEELCASYYPTSDGILKALAAQLITPRALYHMGARWYGPQLYACTRAECEELPDGRIRQTIDIEPGFEDSDLFFRAMKGALRTVPVLVGLPPAEVKLERAPRRGIFTITPPRLSRLERLRHLWQRRRGVLTGADAELTIQFEELRRGYELARSASEERAVHLRLLDAERSERERAEQMLQQAQKLDVMGRLAGGIAHDFKNMLTAISGYAELALDQVEPGSPVRADLEEIRSVTERGNGLVKQILGFSRRQVVTHQRIELDAALLRMETLLRRLLPETIDLVTRPSPQPLPVLADPGQIEQIVVNLVVNARDAMPGGGPIHIDLSRATGPDGARQARLEVRDAGRGMDEATRLRAFEPFFTTKARGKGTGLGLATVEGIVTQSGGRIDLVSEVGKGTRVTITWPLATGDAGTEVPAESGPPPRGSETVLVVEGDAALDGAVVRDLAGAGYEVLEARDEDDALELARTHPGAIELLVTRLGPLAGGGAELASLIDTIRPELRGAVFIAAQEDAPAEALLANHARLAEPFDAPALLRSARRVLDG